MLSPTELSTRLHATDFGDPATRTLIAKARIDAANDPTAQQNVDARQTAVPRVATKGEKSKNAALPASYAGEPAAQPAADAAQTVSAAAAKTEVAAPSLTAKGASDKPFCSSSATLSKPTPVAAERTWSTSVPADYDVAMSLAQVRDYMLAKADAAGMPRERSEERVTYEIEVMRSMLAVGNDDGSVTLPTDAELVRALAPVGDAIANAYKAELNPPPTQTYDGVPVEMRETWIKPEDRADTPRNAVYPGMFNPAMSLDGAIQYVFAYADSMHGKFPNGEGNVPRSYTAEVIDTMIYRMKERGVPEAAIVKALGESARLVVEGYTRMAWEQYYANNPEAAAEHNRMMASNSAQTQDLAAGMTT